jgi:uncharacterized membrane protein YoaK (UPF0700 family)
MFRHEGPSRSARKNTVLAAYLTFVAGFVDASGFLLLGAFTSHVTGSVGHLGRNLAMRNTSAALLVLVLVLAFFFGALLASLLLTAGFRVLPTAYGSALLLEAALVLAFVLVPELGLAQAPHTLRFEAALLCAAMGMQNSLVTRLSGAVVRTTHLTGVVTDLGIDLAQWYRFLRARRARPDAGPSSMAPRVGRSILLATIALSFTAGATTGAFLTLAHARLALLVPALALLLASFHAFRTAARREPKSPTGSQ